MISKGNHMILAGIGSRYAPEDILEICYKIGRELGSQGWVLRSGGAKGCDFAFEKGFDSVGGKKEIFLPYKNFGKKWGRQPCEEDFIEPTKGARVVLKSLIDEYEDFDLNCEDWMWKLTARNMHQVLGYNLKKPSMDVVCYTKNAEEIGGTRWALRLAKKHHIRIWNLGDLDVRKKIELWLK